MNHQTCSLVTTEKPNQRKKVQLYHLPTYSQVPSLVVRKNSIESLTKGGESFTSMSCVIKFVQDRKPCNIIRNQLNQVVTPPNASKFLNQP